MAAPVLSGLVNNAGIVVAGPLEFLPPDALRRSFEANVVGLLALTQACLPLLRAGRGRIVNMSSISGRFASPLLGPYAASKFAVEALSDALRRELAPWDIPVALVEPGAVATPIWQKSAAAAQSLLDGARPRRTPTTRRTSNARSVGPCAPRGRASPPRRWPPWSTRP